MPLPELFDLTGKTALITGSSKGIGKAIAHRMAEHGASVVVSSRKADACAAAVAEINASVGREAAVSIPANIADKASLQALVDQTLARFGQVDALVCNAASNPYFGPQSGISDDQFTKILQNNVVSNHWLIAMVAPAMRARKDGTITIISSIAGIRGTPIIGSYGISKAADMALARNLAAEFGPTTSGSTASRRGWSRPTLPRRCGTTRPSSRPPPAALPSAASAAPTRSPAWRSCWRARRAASRRGRASCSTGA